MKIKKNEQRHKVAAAFQIGLRLLGFCMKAKKIQGFPGFPAVL